MNQLNDQRNQSQFRNFCAHESDQYQILYLNHWNIFEKKVRRTEIWLSFQFSIGIKCHICQLKCMRNPRQQKFESVRGILEDFPPLKNQICSKVINDIISGFSLSRRNISDIVIMILIIIPNVHICNFLPQVLK